MATKWSIIRGMRKSSKCYKIKKQVAYFRIHSLIFSFLPVSTFVVHPLSLLTCTCIFNPVRNNKFYPNNVFYTMQTENLWCNLNHTSNKCIKVKSKYSPKVFIIKNVNITETVTIKSKSLPPFNDCQIINIMLRDLI